MILLHTPLANGVTAQHYTFSLALLMYRAGQSGIAISPRLESSADLPENRNRAVAVVLAEPSVTHLLCVDSDMGFPDDALQRLLARSLPIVSGAYIKREYPKALVHHPLPGGAEPDATGLCEVQRVGMGFVLIRRDVFEQLGPNPFDTYRDEAGTFVSEDYAFCDRWRIACGGKIYLDASIPLDHVGQHLYRIDP